MDHGPMVSSGVGHRARRRLSRDSPEPLLPRRRPFDSPSNRSMDVSVCRGPTPPGRGWEGGLASIRARRARLEALTASIRLPPLVPSDVLPSSPPATRMSPRAASRASLMLEGPLRRITWDDRPPTGLSSPEPRLPLTLPRMATPHHPLPSIGHTHEGLGDLPFTPEEEEEEQRGAGEPMEDVEEMDSEAGGGSDDEETTFDDHPHYPVLHDPVAPLPAPSRPTSFPPPSPPQQSSAPLPRSTPQPSPPPPLYSLPRPPPALESPHPPSPLQSSLPSHSPPQPSPPPPLYTTPHPPPALERASPPPQSSSPQPTSPPPHSSPPSVSPAPQSSPLPPPSSPPPEPSSPTNSPPPQSSPPPASPPPASPTQDPPHSEPSSPTPQSPFPQPAAPTEEPPPTDPSPPTPEKSPPPPTSSTEDPSAAQPSSPAHSSPVEVLPLNYPSVTIEEVASLTLAPSPPLTPETEPGNTSPTTKSSKTPTPSTATSQPPPEQASSRPNTSPPEFSKPTHPSPPLKESSAPAKSPSSAPLARSSASQVEEEVEAASESVSLSSSRSVKPRDPSEYRALVAKMSSADGATRTAATVRVRQLLSSSRDAPVDEMLRLGVLTPALKNLQDNNPAIQYETVWIITNIVSGTTEQTQAVADKGFIPVLVQLVASGEPWVREQAAWALGNMAADTSALRNQIVDAGALRPLVDLTKPQAKVSSLHKVVWALSNIFKLKNLKAPPEDLIYVLETFKDYLLVHRDEEVVADTLWTLTYLTDAGGSEAIQQVLEAGLLPLLVSHLSSRSRQVVYPAIRTLGTIVSGTDSQTEAALDAGMLPPLHNILTEAREARRTKEATWALSNITAGTVEQIQRVVDEGFLHSLLHLIREGVVEVSREAVWAVSNLVAGGSSEQVAALVEAGGASALLTTLHPHAPHRLDLITVDTLLTVMEKTGGEAAVKDMAEAGGVETLKGKLRHEDEEVVERVREILETYFPDAMSGDEGEDEDEKEEEEKDDIEEVNLD